MKILYHHRIASKDGQYVHIEELTHALDKLGHQIIMVGPQAIEKVTFGSEYGIVSLIKRYIPTVLYELLEFGYSLAAYRKLRKAVKQFRPDCLYERYSLYMPAGVWIKRRFRLPMLLEVNAPLFEERSRYGQIKLPWLARWTEKMSWQGADIVLPVTRVLANRIINKGVPESRLRVIPNAIDLEKFSSVPAAENSKKSLGLDGKIVLGFTGFMREWHQLERVIDIISNKRQANRYLLIVGDGPAREGIEQRAAKLGVSDRVTITGVVERNQIVPYVSAFDIALQPAVVEYASPLKLFEYLALGKPIVAPDSPNIKEILQHEHNAILFNAMDLNAFDEAVERVCNDSGLRERLGNAARLTISECDYTWEKNAQQVESLIAGLTKSTYR